MPIVKERKKKRGTKNLRRIFLDHERESTRSRLPRLEIIPPTRADDDVMNKLLNRYRFQVRVNNTCIEPQKCFPCDANNEHFAGDQWQVRSSVHLFSVYMKR